MNRRTWTLLVSLGLAMTFGLLGGLARVPYVALRPGPTFDTLGAVAGQTVVEVTGTQTYPTGGQLNMTTVSVIRDITLYAAMGLWMSGNSALVPRDEIFPSNLSEQQIKQQNERLFRSSESRAETAALRYLGYPTKVVVDVVSVDGAANGKLMAGDRLLTLDGRDISTAQQVVDYLEETDPGQLVQIGFQRGDTAAQQVAIALQAGVKPDRGYLGVGLADQPDVDFDITISLADVGGPSAGLMFALSIVDKLTPGPLAGDNFVAGTGEISPTGDVGSIGGIPFKMIRAREEGATVFLVPAGNCEEAAARAPEGLTLVRVESLTGAVNALDALRAGTQPPACPP